MLRTQLVRAILIMPGKRTPGDQESSMMTPEQRAFLNDEWPRRFRRVQVWVWLRTMGVMGLALEGL